MPISTDFPRTPSGREYVRALASGDISDRDAHQLMDSLRVGQPHHEHALMAVLTAGTSVSSEARKVLAEQDPHRNAKNLPIAVVVHSAPLRVMMSFIFRVAGAHQRARIFGDEAEAERWFLEALG
jgi:hypothetical protein